jgi:hypothetical protein
MMEAEARGRERKMRFFALDNLNDYTCLSALAHAQSRVIAARQVQRMPDKTQNYYFGDGITTGLAIAYSLDSWQVPPSAWLIAGGYRIIS